MNLTDSYLFAATKSPAAYCSNNNTAYGGTWIEAYRLVGRSRFGFPQQEQKAESRISPKMVPSPQCDQMPSANGVKSQTLISYFTTKSSFFFSPTHHPHVHSHTPTLLELV